MSPRNLFQIFIVLCFVVLLLVVTTKTPRAQEPTGGGGRRGGNIREFLGLGPAPDPAAAKKGDPLYQDNCAGCHGKDARGAQAPGLTRMPLVIADYKGEKLAEVLKEGRQGMPKFPQLSKDDVFSISQFLQLQIELAANRGTYGSTYGGFMTVSSSGLNSARRFFCWA